MRIVTWNCNGAFRRKLQQVDALQADILVIQECENPEASDADYKRWSGKYLWAGKDKSRGIGIFLRRGNSLERLDWEDQGLEAFLPVRIDGHMDLVVVWTKKTKSSAYIGQFWRYLQLHKSVLNIDTVICGDFNSNTIWDKRARVWNHSECVRELEECGFRSLYHQSTSEPQGLETCPTFFLQRNPSKPYHIDYAFVHQNRNVNGTAGLTIGKPDDWLKYSDHMPLTFEL